MSHPLLILDLDETLIHATETELPSAPDFRVGQYFVYRRPHLSAFLAYCFADFEVAVWTSASRAYASEVVAQVFGERQLRFLWTAERCTLRTDFNRHDRYTVKDLKKVRKLGIPLEQVLMVDDLPKNLERQYSNLIQIAPFEGNPADVELPALAEYLRLIRPRPNYRPVEKRYWRTVPTSG